MYFGGPRGVEYGNNLHSMVCNIFGDWVGWCTFILRVPAGGVGDGLKSLKVIKNANQGMFFLGFGNPGGGYGLVQLPFGGAQIQG